MWPDSPILAKAAFFTSCFLTWPALPALYHLAVCLEEKGRICCPAQRGSTAFVLAVIVWSKNRTPARRIRPGHIFRQRNTPRMSWPSAKTFGVGYTETGGPRRPGDVRSVSPSRLLLHARRPTPTRRGPRVLLTSNKVTVPRLLPSISHSGVSTWSISVHGLVLLVLASTRGVSPRRLELESCGVRNAASPQCAGTCRA